jgi:hypothetical protein
MRTRSCAGVQPAARSLENTACLAPEGAARWLSLSARLDPARADAVPKRVRVSPGQYQPRYGEGSALR